MITEAGVGKGARLCVAGAGGILGPHPGEHAKPAALYCHLAGRLVPRAGRVE
eukprot:CAMPEP_0173349972 /NCGR_PEP_ID=MMETSP1144-20121109/14616_1 /TAXON_ID=483371 /ORGANISM="non described non described, Strain CCMP2298" /LENGTH=51 /DNA_ID=CAMNT_0014297849 /DNA_START=96 /DNA_END=251 /DNA_ORIENTATION=-